MSIDVRVSCGYVVVRDNGSERSYAMTPGESPGDTLERFAHLFETKAETARISAMHVTEALAALGSKP